MSDPNSPDASDLSDPEDTAPLDPARHSTWNTIDTTARDPDRHSTWNTIDSTVDVDEVLDEDDLENFFIEPIPNPLDPGVSPDVEE